MTTFNLQTWRTIAVATSVFVAYVVVARLGLMLDAVSGFASLVWAPTGLSLVALLLFGARFSASVFLGALVVNVWTGAPVLVALGIAIGNTLEAVLGAHALRLSGYRRSFNRLRHVMVLIGPVAMLSTLVSATMGVMSLRLGGIVRAHHAFETWRAWWVGDMLGDLVVAPLLLTWATVEALDLRPMRILETLALGATLTTASLLVFSRPLAFARYPLESPYALFPLFVWAAVRFELRGAATATALASSLAIWGTVRGSGPFVRETLSQSLLALQAFMGSAAFTPLVVAGAMSDRARAVRVRESFVATVSHDLKNPLAAIQMSAASLARHVPADVAEGRVQKHVQLVRRNVDRMVGLIGDLLDVSAIDAGRLSVEQRGEDAAVLINEVVDALQPLAAARKQTLRAGRVDGGQILCDRKRVLQVLSNLIGNAIKFTNERGIITLEMRRAGGMARFSVEDTGIGIEPAHLRHIFERHWHAGPTYGGGTGLGLFIAKGIVEAHGGRLWAESRVGAGSTFHFTLRMCEEGDHDVR